MERLTYEKSPNRWNSGKYPTKYTSRHTFQEVVARLAAYEDTGLEPEEVKEHEAAYIEIMTRTYGPLHQKIGRWLQAEKDGHLVVLQEGATVRRLQEEYHQAKHMADERLPSPDYTTGRIAGFGAGVIHILDKILTREEAETALKKRGEGTT